MPLFLFSAAGMNTFQIGVVMIVTGVFQFFSAPFAGKMYDAGVNRRFMLAIGFLLFGFGCYLNSNLTPDSRFWDFFLPQAVRGFALMFCFIPVNEVALGTMPKEEVQNAGGLYNLMRNLGGAIGLAVINTNITSNTKIYSSYLKEDITSADSWKLQGLQDYLGGFIFDPEVASYVFLNNLIQRDAFITAINDVFISIALIFTGSVVLILFADDTDGIEEDTLH
jgi:DHA2 family multidrug resistance protein